MLNKIILSTLCTSALLLTACGGGGDKQSTFTSTTPIQAINWSKASDLDLVAEYVMNAAISLNPENNLTVLLYKTYAEAIFENIFNTQTLSVCDSGSVKKTGNITNGTIIFNNCKLSKTLFTIEETGESINLDNGATFSGTIEFSNLQAFNSYSYKNKITFSGLKLTTDYANHTMIGEITKTHNDYLSESEDISEQYASNIYDSSNLEVISTDKNGNQESTFTFKNYSIKQENILTSTPTNSEQNIIFNSKGILSISADKRSFAIQFNTSPSINLSTNSGKITIEDSTNLKNSITLEGINNNEMLYSAFSNGKSVSGFPKNISWNYFN